MDGGKGSGMMKNYDEVEILTREQEERGAIREEEERDSGGEKGR